MKKRILETKLADGQVARIPTLQSDGSYLVHTMYGRALTNAKGKILHMIYNDDMSIEGGYIIGEKAVYDLNMEVAYNLVENNATVIDTIGDTVLIQKGEDTSKAYNIVALRGGEVEMICRYEAEASETTKFVSVEGASCYALYNTATGEYTYYNADGEQLIKTKVRLSVLASSIQEGVVLLSGMEGETVVYYAFAE